MLATSREPLRVRTEQVIPLAPLSLPDAQHLRDLELLTQVPSVALFLARAHAADPAFSMTNDNASAVARICRRLDGLPLAIELAAARVRLLPPAALLTRLEHSLSLLTSGARDAPARQRTLRETIAWSSDLLSVEEQALFRHLSVFVGGWTLEAAEAVVDPDGNPDVLEGLASLVDKSLVHRREQPDRSVRFGMLETVREFGLELLTADEDAAAVQRAHATHYQRLAESSDSHLLLPGQESWLLSLETEMSNMRAALAWLTSHDPASALALAGSLRWFWLICGNLNDGRTILEQTVSLAADAPLLVRARALIGLGFLEAILGDTEHAEPVLRLGQALAQQADNPWERGWALLGLGIAAMQRQAYGESDARLQEAIAVVKPMETHHPAARARVFAFLCDLGGSAIAQGQFDLADIRLDAALAGARETGFSWLESLTQINRGTLATRRGALHQALSYYREALVLAQEHHDRRLAAEALEGVADIARRLGRPERAQDVLTLAMALRHAILLAPVNSPAGNGETQLAKEAGDAWDDALNEITSLLEDANT
jgi:predicted ATPase